MENDVMTWRCRGCGHATPCGEPECARCGATRTAASFDGLEQALAGLAPDEEPMTEQQERAFMAAYGPDEEPATERQEPATTSTTCSPAPGARGPGLAKKFLAWACGAFVAACAGSVIVLGSLLGIAVLVGTMLKLRRR